MFVRAIDEDGGFNGPDDHIDDVFINMSLPVNTEFTPSRNFNGQEDEVTIEMSFRVTCSKNYYGPNCMTFCVSPNSSYACDNNGSLYCQRDCTDRSEFSLYIKITVM